MKKRLTGLYYSFPVQLLILHLKKYQVLLIFWYLLFSVVNGSFMKSYGADSLFLAPEYLGSVNPGGLAIVGVAMGIFIMSWNITSFILFSRYFRFLATTTNPFLKYCINNSLLPLGFLFFYFFKAVHFGLQKELFDGWRIFLLVAGFLGGLVMLLLISFIYFFRYDRSIVRQLTPVISNPRLFKSQFRHQETRLKESRLIRVEWYLRSPFSIKKVRDVSHYSREFIEAIFSRHHFAAVLSIFISFIFLVLVGFMLDNPLFQLPAAAGITIFFAILIALSGALSYFLQNWTIPFLLLLFVVLNQLYRYNVIDPTNKAYGLNYNNRNDRPAYDRDQLLSLCAPGRVTADSLHMIRILEKWKARQTEEKPLMFIINCSGGGNRSANFTMNVLQRLDSLSQGAIMRKTFLITGSSGGMLGATYFRELARERAEGLPVNPRDPRYVDDISGDLLNALFTSFVARDLASPAQKFKVGDYTYIKDRGYAFEQKLNQNTGGRLNLRLKDLSADEAESRIPLMLYNSVITRDGRKLIISTQPVSFLMRPVIDSSFQPPADPDAVDYGAFFARQDPLNLRLLTAMRMNATFPYVLPNVWLPTRPVVDVMDAGLRDNFGIESAVRFTNFFRDWIRQHTQGVVFLQIRDRKAGGWESPFESNNITEIFTKPMLLLQFNWYKMQEYNQNDMLSLLQEVMGNQLGRITFQYEPENEEAAAALNFHLTRGEKQNIAQALGSPGNLEAFARFGRLLKDTSALSLTRE